MSLSEGAPASRAPPTGSGDRGSWLLHAVSRAVWERQKPLSPQVPQDDWGGYPAGGKDGEIPCRRMRSGSYIKAMGDEESGDSDGSPKTSPKAVARRFTSRRSSSVDQARIKYGQGGPGAGVGSWYWVPADVCGVRTRGVPCLGFIWGVSPCPT